MIVRFDYIKNRNRCSIQISDADIRERLMMAFSCEDESMKYVKGPSYRFSSNRLFFISPTGTYDFGLTELIIKWIKDFVNDRTVTYEFSDEFKKQFETENVPEKIYDDLELKLRDYQETCVRKALKYKFGIFVIGTGGGKTLIITSIINNLFKLNKVKKVLIVVPDDGLVTQFYNELTNVYKIDKKVSKFYDKFNKLDENADIIIANRPLLLSRYNQYKNQWVNGFDCLIVDEAHSIKRGNKISKCISNMNTKYRFGFTGTISESSKDYMKNFGILGPIRYEKTSKELRDDNFLSDVIIKNLNLIYPEQPPRLTYQQEIEELNKNKYRNNFLMKLYSIINNNTLIMVNRLEHGFILEEIFKENIKNKKIYFIRGEIDVNSRDKIKKLMEEENNIICIAISKIFSTGINIKNLHNIILASGGKSSIMVVQSIGRGLRLHPNKKKLTIFDISDNGYRYSTAHVNKRKKIYKKEKINVESADIILRTNV